MGLSSLGRVVTGAVVALGLASCSDDDQIPAPPVMPLVLSSLNLSNGGVFEAVNTCAGADLSPQLSWAGGPPNALTYAITLTDITTGTDQWALWDLTGSVRSLTAGLSADPLLPNNPPLGTSTPAKQSQASGGFGYEGPCPMGTPHTYRLRIDAIGASPLPGVVPGSAPAAVAAAIAPASLEHSEIMASSAASPL